MRYAFVNELIKRAKNNKNLYLLTADLGYTVFENFQKTYPKQFINVGIAEANMMGLAAGMALCGKTVFTYSISTFATLRPYEQIRNDICSHNAHVIIVGSGAGLSYSDGGLTHHGVQDIALMRLLPNMTVLCPADPTEVSWAVSEAIKLKGPVYIRLGKKGEPNLYTNNKNIKLKLGQGSELKKGKDIALIGTGNIVYNVTKAAEILEKKGLSTAVISMHTVKPIDKKIIKELSKNVKMIITVEEHSLIGGLGDAVLDNINNFSNHKIHFLKIGLTDEFVKCAGTHDFLRKKYNLSPEKIAQKVLSIYKKI